MEPEFLKTDKDDLVDSGLPRESPFREDQCQIKSSLLHRNADAFNDKMSRKYPYYDKTYHTKPGRDGGNPFASKRNEEDQIATQGKPQETPHEFEHSEKDEKWLKEMGVKHSTPRKNDLKKEPVDLPPREDLKNYGSQEADAELDKDNGNDPDLRVQSSLLVRSYNHMLNKTRTAKKVAAVASLKGLTSSVKSYDQHLIVNIPRNKTANLEFTSDKIAKMENEISKALQVRAKYSHFLVDSSYDGIALEFLLV